MATKIPDNLIPAINKYLEGTATAEETEIVNRWYSSFNDAEVQVPAESLQMKAEIDARLRSRLEIRSENQVKELELYPERGSAWFRTAAAAAIIVLISTGAYFFLHHSNESKLVEKVRPVKKEIQSFDGKITLTLQDCSRISLNDAESGEILNKDGIIISKTPDGDLIYGLQNSDQAKLSTLGSHTIATPSGSRILLTLPDGSKVSLNASSSFQFPVAFSNDKFNTKLDGEAFFEITPNKSRKFKVRSGMQIVEVLGTRFNISAYRDEPAINTTLLEGSIRITDLRKAEAQLLRPGQKAEFNKSLVLSEVEASEAIAWTEGYFQFNNADIKTVMRELERWYGIKVRYEGAVTSQKFEGAIDKKLDLKQVLGILEKSQVHFKIEEKIVTVKP